MYVDAPAGLAGTGRTLVWVDRAGKEEPLAAPPRAYLQPRLSPDGTRVAVFSADQEQDLWSWDLRRATLTRLTFEPGADAFPVWTPDGRRIIFASDRAGGVPQFVVAGGRRHRRRRAADHEQQRPIAHRDRTGRHRGRLLRSHADDGPRSAAARARWQPPRDATPADEIRRAQRDCLARRPLAGVRVGQLGAFEIYVRPFPNAGGGQWQVSTGGGTTPLWARSGKELFYVGPDGALLRVPVEASGATWNAGTPTKLLEGRYFTGGAGANIGRAYDVSPDGQRFLMIKAPGADATAAPPSIIVVQHWDRRAETPRPHDTLMALSTGSRLGPYEIQSALGAGGMGEVYKARDTRLDRTVAIKVLPADVASDPQFRERFDREARTISSLNHPHICTLHDIGSQNGIDFLVMEYLDGETLADRLTKGALPYEQALQYAIQIGDALATAHRAGITHRDLKPGNVMLTKAGAKLLDFGLAKTGGPAVAGAGLSMLPTTPPNLTAQGTILGTFQYMAPEQLEGQEADARTDVFAFGAVVYEMITGKKAFEGKSHASLIGAIMHSEPPSISTPQRLAPPLLEYIVGRCLAKTADHRWQSTHDIRLALEAVRIEAASSAVTAAPRAWWKPVAATVVAASVGLAAGAFLRSGQNPIERQRGCRLRGPPRRRSRTLVDRRSLSRRTERKLFSCPITSST